MTDVPVKVLIADDEPTLLSLLETVLRERRDCSLESARDGQEAFEKLQANLPDLLITDLKMPRLSGEDLTVKALARRPDLTVVILTGNGTLESAVRLMKRGVYDYITKPFSLDDFSARVDRAIHRIRCVPLSKRSQEIVDAFMIALETKDHYLRNHSARVAEMAHRLSLDLGLSARDAFLVKRGGLVHDLGKIGIPETILNKPGPLTKEEYSIVQRHSAYSARIIEPLQEFRECIDVVCHHHEHFDGTGYPSGASGGDIPLGARIIAVCDAYDAMASDRSYRRALPREEIEAQLRKGRGKQFDPEIIDALSKSFKM